MRVKRQKRHRKSVRFYTACYGFRQPYRVLCDVTFVHHLITNLITPADKAISNVLGAPVLLFTTKCAIAKLKQHGPMLGPSYSQSLEAANSLITARCDHESHVSAEDCILDVVGQSNSEHFFVATHHVDLHRKLLKTPGVPTIYALMTALLFKSPSDNQHQFVKTFKEQRLHMTNLEYKLLKKQKNISNSLKINDPPGEEDGYGDQNMEAQAVANRDIARIGLGVKDKVQFNRKKAKVLPNSFLSCSSWKHITSTPAPPVSPSHNVVEYLQLQQSLSLVLDCRPYGVVSASGTARPEKKLVPKRKRKRSPVATDFARAALDSVSYGSC
ncbi:hypothetical protein ACFXTH_043973 [Malus domestica]